MGILRDDPRLKPIIESIQDIKDEKSGSLGLDNVDLDYKQFEK